MGVEVKIPFSRQSARILGSVVDSTSSFSDSITDSDSKTNILTGKFSRVALSSFKLFRNL
jgi:hypothetical protein